MNKDYKELYWNLKFDYNVIKEDYDRLKHYDNQRVEMLRVLQEQYSELEKENEELLNKLNNKGENTMSKTIRLEFEQDLDYIKDALVCKRSKLEETINILVSSNCDNKIIENFSDDILNINGILDRFSK